MSELIAQAEALEWAAQRCEIEHAGYIEPREGWRMGDPSHSQYAGYQRACSDLEDSFRSRAAELRAQAEQPAEPVARIKAFAGTNNWTFEVLGKLQPGDLLYRHPDPRIAALEGRIALLERLLADAHVTMNHASIFISTREKMHPTGQELYGKLSADIAAALNASQTERK